MTSNENHVATDDLHLMLDGRLSPQSTEVVVRHIAECPRCRALLHSMEEIDSSLRILPVERTTPAFSDYVMRRIDIRQESSLWIRLLQNLTGVVSMGFVLAGLGLMYIYGKRFFGITQPESEGILSRLLAGGLEDSAAYVDTITKLLKSFVPYIFGENVLPVVVSAAIVIFVIGAFDRLLMRGGFHR